MAFGAGGIVGLQAVINARLGRELGSPALATLASFAIGTVFVTVYCLAARVALPNSAVLMRVPVWAWLGGLLGRVLCGFDHPDGPSAGRGNRGGAGCGGADADGGLPGSLGIAGPGAASYLARTAARHGGLLVAGVVLLKRF